MTIHLEAYTIAIISLFFIQCLSESSYLITTKIVAMIFRVLFSNPRVSLSRSSLFLYISFSFPFFLTLTHSLFSISSLVTSPCFLQTILRAIYRIFSDKFVGPDHAVLVGNPQVVIQGKALPFLLIPLLLRKEDLLVFLYYTHTLSLFLSIFLPHFSSSPQSQPEFSDATTTKLNESQMRYEADPTSTGRQDIHQFFLIFCRSWSRSPRRSSFSRYSR